MVGLLVTSALVSLIFGKKAAQGCFWTGIAYFGALMFASIAFFVWLWNNTPLTVPMPSSSYSVPMPPVPNSDPIHTHDNAQSPSSSSGTFSPIGTWLFSIPGHDPDPAHPEYMKWNPGGAIMRSNTGLGGPFERTGYSWSRTANGLVFNNGAGNIVTMNVIDNDDMSDGLATYQRVR